MTLSIPRNPSPVLQMKSRGVPREAPCRGRTIAQTIEMTQERGLGSRRVGNRGCGRDTLDRCLHVSDSRRAAPEQRFGNFPQGVVARVARYELVRRPYGSVSPWMVGVAKAVDKTPRLSQVSGRYFTHLVIQTSPLSSEPVPPDTGASASVRPHVARATIGISQCCQIRFGLQLVRLRSFGSASWR